MRAENLFLLVEPNTTLQYSTLLTISAGLGLVSEKMWLEKSLLGV